MPRERRLVAVFLICTFAIISAPAAAQSAVSGDTQGLPARGDRVEITTVDGRTHKGRVETADATAISVVNGSRRGVFRLDEIAVIESPKDPLWNGTLFGLAAGLAAGAVLADTEESESPFCGMGFLDDCGGGGRGAAMIAGGALGALLGASLDALIHKRDRTIYRRQPPVTIVPSIEGRSRRLVLSVSW